MAKNTIVKLLIVDDELEDLKLMTNILEKEGYQIQTANSGAEALKILEDNDIHIVLLDILMPDMTGYHTCLEIRKRFKEKPIQIILISGLTLDHFLEQAIEVGGDDFIYKPINILELQRRIKIAGMRLRNQLKLYHEKIKLEKKVAIKEEYSSKIEKEKESIQKQNIKLLDTNEELKKVATFDPLTGLYNRKEIIYKIDNEIERFNRTGLPLTGVMLDVDRFKEVNDTYGHQTGDIVLRELGRMLRTSLRKNDHAGRYGGEEFFLVLSNTALEQGTAIGQRFRTDMASFTFRHENKEFHVTVSLGVAQYRRGESRETWIERIDKALYRAKALGRNCTVQDEELVAYKK